METTSTKIPVSDVERTRIHEMAQAGKSPTQIAKELHRGFYTIQSILKDQTITASSTDLAYPDAAIGVTASADAPKVAVAKKKKERRRLFPEAFKRLIVEKAEACTEPGAVSALLLKYKLHSSYLTTWRRTLKMKPTTRQASKLVGASANKQKLAKVNDALTKVNDLKDLADRLVQMILREYPDTASCNIDTKTGAVTLEIITRKQVVL